MLPSKRPETPAGADTEEGPLWSTIKRQLYRSEVAHVKRLVGESLIQKNRTMWDELGSLKQILTEFEQQNEELSEGVEKQVLFCGSQARDLLRRQAQIVLDDLADKAETSGQRLEDMMPELRDKQLMDFITGGKACQRPSSAASSKLGARWTPPATPSTRPPSSGGRSGCSTPDLVAGCLPLPLGRALKLEDLALVAEGIREALQSEHESLLSAIGEQMEHFEAEADHRAQAVGRLSRGEPSTAKLQQFVNKLQELASSPSLRTLTLTGGPGERGPGEPACPTSPVAGASSVRRLQALIAQRRSSDTPRRSSKSPGLGAVPEVLDCETTPPRGGYPSPGGGGSDAPAAPKATFDPFFDDPFDNPLFAAGVGAGCLPNQDIGILS